MRLTIYFDTKGRIIPANNLRAPARSYPICVEKQNRKLRIFINKKVTTDALISLLRHIRILKDGIFELTSELPALAPDVFEEADLCFLRIGQACLELFEKKSDGQFLSHLDFWEESAEDPDQLPFEITNLTKLKIAHLDTPTALAQLLQNETVNAAFYHFTADQRLSLIKLPENMVHPPIAKIRWTRLERPCRTNNIVNGCKSPDRLLSLRRNLYANLASSSLAAGQKPACTPL